MSLITPTVGRVLHFYPGPFPDPRMAIFGDQPMRADLCFVHNDNLVNVIVNDHAGTAFPMQKVQLVQDGEPNPGREHVIWMPYQVGQAKALASAGTTGAATSPATSSSTSPVVDHVAADSAAAASTTTAAADALAAAHADAANQGGADTVNANPGNAAANADNTAHAS